MRLKRSTKAGVPRRVPRQVPREVLRKALRKVSNIVSRSMRGAMVARLSREAGCSVRGRPQPSRPLLGASHHPPPAAPPPPDPPLKKRPPLVGVQGAALRRGARFRCRGDGGDTKRQLRWQSHPPPPHASPRAHATGRAPRDRHARARTWPPASSREHTAGGRGCRRPGGRRPGGVNVRLLPRRPAPSRRGSIASDPPQPRLATPCPSFQLEEIRLTLEPQPTCDTIRITGPGGWPRTVGQDLKFESTGGKMMLAPHSARRVETRRAE